MLRNGRTEQQISIMFDIMPAQVKRIAKERPSSRLDWEDMRAAMTVHPLETDHE